MLGTVDKIIGLVSDPNSLKTAIDTTDSVTSNPDQMPTDNQAQGANVMESMGNCMKTIKASPEEINNIAGSMLGTTGNVFLAASGTVPVISKNDSEIDLFVIILILKCIFCHAKIFEKMNILIWSQIFR